MKENDNSTHNDDVERDLDLSNIYTTLHCEQTIEIFLFQTCRVHSFHLKRNYSCLELIVVDENIFVTFFTQKR